MADGLRYFLKKMLLDDRLAEKIAYILSKGRKKKPSSHRIINKQNLYSNEKICTNVWNGHDGRITDGGDPSRGT